MKTDTDNLTPPAAEQQAVSRHQLVTLSTPIVRGEVSIEQLNLRKPKAGELRGLSLADVIGSDITALLTLIPRISEPPLTSDEANQLEPEDLSEIGGTVRGFFMTRAEKLMLEQMISAHQPRT